MNENWVGRSVEFLTKAFPFLFVVEPDLRLSFVSPRILEFAPDVKPGALLSEHFYAVRPERLLSIADLRAVEESVVILEFRSNRRARLRGEFFSESQAEFSPLYFLGHPWVTDLKELELAGLTLADFPAHAGLTDMLVLLQTMKSGHAEARSLATELEKTSLALEDRNKELEQELDRTKRLEETVLQAQKMEAIGQLAAGVAHDFNNILLAINGHAGLVAGECSSDPSTVEHMDDILDACRRAAQLTARLLAFGRRQVMVPTEVEIVQSFKEVERMLQPLLGEQVCLTVDCSPDLGTVVIDPSAMQQILMNLALNARDSFVSGGSIEISALREELSDTRVLGSGQELRAGSWIKIEVLDDGCGMTDDVRLHIFEPYFTTKHASSGTGLGLSTVWWIVDRCGGAIGVQTEVGEGTRFEVYLPASDSTDARPVEPVKVVDSARSRKSMGEVLLVEDEEIVRRPIAQMLERLGWMVSVAACADEALALVKDRSHPFDLVLTDVVMPGRSGRELAKVLRQHWEDIPIVFITGYDPETSGGMVSDGEWVLPKPFNLNGLARAITRAIER